MALTNKQEAFAQAIVSGLNQSDAYRAAFDVRENTKLTSINVNASKMMSDANVMQRVAELRAPIVEAVGITLKGHLEDLLMLRDKALEANQINAAISAEVARGKAGGVWAVKIELTGKDGAPIKTQAVTDMTDEELALKLAKYGIKQ